MNYYQYLNILRYKWYIVFYIIVRTVLIYCRDLPHNTCEVFNTLSTNVLFHPVRRGAAALPWTPCLRTARQTLGSRWSSMVTRWCGPSTPSSRSCSWTWPRNVSMRSFYTWPHNVRVRSCSWTWPRNVSGRSCSWTWSRNVSGRSSSWTWPRNVSGRSCSWT